ncbi:hypothetical protein [Caldimonas brevitalea]|uniref:Uncharacterized protein n=1 Tax=Caldimonas brevitalea TaxID=413882 RepID=A0A0G3BWB1_9BURK|nr:hypothetical protein [Caldimonas brevitalea]AKJ30790.1 hypothetical protein AAW51_4099 [Caldimonas brevitalea]
MSVDRRTVLQTCLVATAAICAGAEPVIARALRFSTPLDAADDTSNVALFLTQIEIGGATRLVGYVGEVGVDLSAAGRALKVHVPTSWSELATTANLQRVRALIVCLERSGAVQLHSVDLGPTTRRSLPSLASMLMVPGVRSVSLNHDAQVVAIV